MKSPPLDAVPGGHRDPARADRAALRVPALLPCRDVAQDEGRPVRARAQPVPGEPDARRLLRRPRRRAASASSSRTASSRGVAATMPGDLSSHSRSATRSPGCRPPLGSAASSSAGRCHCGSSRRSPSSSRTSRSSARSGLYNQLPALILVYTIFNLPLSIWMLSGSCSEIPIEIEEAALVDGASRWYAFRHMLLPLARTGILAAGIVVFAFDWAEFLFAFILTATPQAHDLPGRRPGARHPVRDHLERHGGRRRHRDPRPAGLMLIARRHVITGLTFGVIRDK